MPAPLAAGTLLLPSTTSARAAPWSKPQATTAAAPSPNGRRLN
jgi:hypothetical protein